MKTLFAFTLLFASLATAQSIRWDQIKASDRHGTGTKGQASDGTGTSGNCAKFDASGNITDSGAACSGSVTSVVIAGTSNQVTVSGTCTITTTGTCTLALPSVLTLPGTINKLTLTAPATGSTITIADGKTLTASNSITLAGTDSTTMTFPSSSATITQTIASGTSALGTTAISANSCASVVTTAATGTASTDTITWAPNADISGVTGYGYTSTDGLIIYPYPTSNNVNWKVCNATASSITPGAVTLNWRVVR